MQASTDIGDEREQLIHAAAHRLALRASGMKPANRALTKPQYDCYMNVLMERFSGYPNDVLTRITFHPVNRLGSSRVLALINLIASGMDAATAEDYLTLHETL